MPVTSHPNESPAYRKQRAALLEAEIALKNEIERVAALRRAASCTSPRSSTDPTRPSC